MFTDENMTAKEELFAWLRHMNKNKGSDLFVTTHFPPAMKLDGKITRITDEPLTAEKCMEIAFSIMSAKQAEEFSSTNECNFAISLPDTSRFRVNAMIQRGATALVFRAITSKIPKFESLNLPPALKDVALKKRGLVIFVGGTGSGKSTSLASLIDYRNENSFGHIITIEDPIEFVHEHKNCIITQREVGVDTENWMAALKNTLRQAPDVILIGEIRDRETMDYAIAFAETGAFVYGDAARQQHQSGARPHHQLLPRGAARTIADGFVAQPSGVYFATPRSARRRQGQGGGSRGTAQFAPDFGVDSQRQHP